MTRTTNDADWIERAKRITEASIDQLVLEFLEFPYLHRVEHSIHTRLYGILKAQPHFDRLFQMADGNWTQAIHKEWPETKVRVDKLNVEHRRGNFDLAILSPGQVEEASSADFEVGRIEPPIVIEMGLHYDEKHLSDDADKLVNSEVPHAYLVHLVRRKQRKSAFDDRIAALNKLIASFEKKSPRIQVAFAAVQGEEKSVKLLSDSSIELLK